MPKVIKQTDTKLPLISIITAVFNGNSTIEETIKSVINQNYPNMEYLIIDGGSTDGTIETLKKYDDHIDYWVSAPDKGVYDAFNKGIDLARGEWLYFLGADDRFYDGDVLRRFFSKPHNSKMIYGNVIWGNTDKIYDGEFNKSRFNFQNICQQAIFYHRELFKMIGKFDLKYGISADWVFNMKVFSLKNTTPTFINAIVAFYSTEGMSNRQIDEAEAFARKRDKLFKEFFGLWTYLYARINGYIRGILSRLGRSHLISDRRL